MATTKKTNPTEAEVDTTEVDAKPATTPASAPDSPSKKGEDDGIERVTFTVEIRGKSLDITTPLSMDDGPMEAMEYAQDGRYIKAFLAMIGPKQEHKLKSTLRPTGREFDEIVMAAWQEATGLGED